MENEEDSNWCEDIFRLLNLFVVILFFLIAQAAVINVQSSVIAGSKKSDKYLQLYFPAHVAMLWLCLFF